MAYVDVEWTTPESISKTKLDQMEDNAAFLYDNVGRAQYQLCGGGRVRLDTSGETVRVEAYVDGVYIGSKVVDNHGPHTIVFSNIEDFSTGAHELQLKFVDDDTDEELSMRSDLDADGSTRMKFWRGEAHNYAYIALASNGTNHRYVGPFTLWARRN